jgi:hypothetical protein
LKRGFGVTRCVWWWTTNHHPKSKGKRKKKTQKKQKIKNKGEKHTHPTHLLVWIFHFPWSFLAPSYFLSTKEEGEEEEVPPPAPPPQWKISLEIWKRHVYKMECHAMQFLASCFFSWFVSNMPSEYTKNDSVGLFGE